MLYKHFFKRALYITDIPYFSAYIVQWADKEQRSYNTLREQIKEWYNGYHFGKSAVAVYNPFSLMYALNTKEYNNYWFQSGTPTFLVNILKKEYKNFDPEQLEATGDLLQNTFDVNMIPLIALMFQAGYLTIASYSSTRDTYTLDYPNREAKAACQKLFFLIYPPNESKATLMSPTQ
jgi:hypothetical protein